MSQADGSVIIDTHIKTDEFNGGIKDIKQAVRSLTGELNAMSDNAKFALQRQMNSLEKLYNSYSSQEKKVQDLQDKLEEMSKQKVSTAAYSEAEKEISKLETALDKATQKQKELVESGKGTSLTPEYVAASKQVEKLDNALLNAYNRKEKFLESGGSESSRTFKNIEYDIERIERQLQQATADKEKLESSKTQKTDAFIGLEKEIEDIKQSLAEANAQKEKLETSGGAYKAVDTSAITSKLIAEQQKLQQMENTLNVSYDALRSKVEQYSNSVSEAANRHGTLRKALTSVYGAMKKSVSIVGGVAQKAYNSFLKVVNKLKSAMLGLHKNTQKSNNSINLGIRNILKYTLSVSGLIAIFKKIGNAAKEGFSNLYEENTRLRNSVDSLKASLLTLKNALAAAFAPIAQIAIPYIQRLVEWITKAVNLIGQLLAALTGKKTYTKAINQTAKSNDTAAKAADKAAKATKKEADALKDAEKAAEGYLSPLDEINKYEDNSADISLDIPSDIDDTLKDELGDIGDSLGTMFEEIPIESSILDAAEKIKSILSALFSPLLEAWNREGKFVLDSWKFGLNEVWKLIKDIGRDFLTVWQEEATIKIFQNILHIIGDIGLVVGNLARNFREAWNTNEVGLNILRNIRDVIGIIVQHIKNMADKTVEWSKSLDFYPILDAFERFLKSIEPVVDAIWGIIEDFYTKVLLPLSKWTLEKGLPELLQVFIDFNNKVDWAALRANLAEFWEHLEPFAETVGEGLIIFIKRVSDALAKFLNSKEFKDFLVSVENWMDKVTPQDVADALEMIAKSLIALKVALLGYSALKGIASVLTTIKTFLSFFGAGGGAAGVGTAMESVAGSAGVLSNALGTLATAIAGVGIFDVAIKNPLFDLMEAMGANADVVDDMRERYGKLGGTIDIVKDTFSVAKNAMQGYGAVISDTSQLGKALEKAMNDIAKGTIYTDEHLAQLKERFGATDDDIEMLRQEMLDTNPTLRELADNFGLFDASAETLQDVQQGMKLLEDGTLTAADAFKEFSKPMWGMNDAALEFFQTLSDSGMTFDEYKASLENTSGAVQQFSSDVVEASANIGEGLTAGMESVDTDSPAQGFFSRVVESIKNIFGIHSPASTMMPFGENILLGVLEGFKSQFDLFYESVSQLLDQISLKLTEGWESMKQNAIETWESVKESVLETWENIKQAAAETWELIKEDISNKITNIQEKISSVMESAKQKWSDAWNNMKEKVSSIMESVKSTIQSAFDWISEKVSAIKEKISSIGSGISGAASRVFGTSSYSINVPNLQVPVMPLPAIATAHIPYLASGAVIPPNAPFLAVLGDQKRGTNVEAPLSAIEDAVNKAVRNAMLQSNQQRNGTYVFNAQINRRTLFHEVIEEAHLVQMANGRNPFELA